MNLLDPLVVGYVAFSVWRGRTRGFARELPRLISLTLALVAGGGLWHWMEKGLETANQATLKLGGPLAFFVVVGGACLMVWKLRRRIRDWARARVPEPERQRRLGMITGGLRGLALCALVLLLLGAIPIGEFRKPFTRGSFFGRLVHNIVRPAYAAAHHKA